MKALLLVAAGVLSRTRAQLYVDYDRVRPLHIVDEQYINYNIDTGSLYNGMDFGDPKFRQLVRQLTAPFGPQVLRFAAREPTFFVIRLPLFDAQATIRIGGTAVDSSFYFPDTPYRIGQPNQVARCLRQPRVPTSRGCCKLTRSAAGTVQTARATSVRRCWMQVCAVFRRQVWG
jgi:hypothetical protein